VKVLVDTSVWSEAFRRNHPLKGDHAHELARLIENGEAALIGSIRQELLSGLADAKQFQKLRNALNPFPDEALDTEDFVSAAACFNKCRQRGVQGEHVDFLICAIAIKYDLPIFTVDKDFIQYAKILPIKLHMTTVQ
jgi:predicted nucleic acid-binding protein